MIQNKQKELGINTHKAAQGLKYMNIIGRVTKKMTAVIFSILRDNKVYTPALPDTV